MAIDPRVSGIFEPGSPTGTVGASTFLPAIGLGLQAFGSIAKTLAIRDTSRLNAFIASKNAELADIKARVVKKETDIAVSLKRKEGRRFLSMQRALIGATGLTSESFERIVEQTVIDTELDALAVRFRGITREGEVRAKGGRQRIEEVVQRGKAKRAGFEALLSGLGSSLKITEELKKQGVIK